MQSKKLVDGRNVAGEEITHRIMGLLEELGKLTRGDSLMAHLLEGKQMPPIKEPKSYRTRDLDVGTDRLIRLKEVLALICVSKSTWWSGVKSGRYPSPVHHLGPRITAWKMSDVMQLVTGGKQ